MKKLIGISVGISVVALLVIIPLVGLSTAKLDLTLPYLLLATKKTKTMQKELNKAAEAGYRIVVGSPTSGEEIMVILEKMPESSGYFEYFLLATTRTGTMQKEMSAAAAKGFRLRPSTLIKKKRFGFGLGGKFEIIMIMEKAPEEEIRYEYLLLATTKTGTLQKEITESVGEGYSMVGLVRRDEHIAIMERSTGIPPE